MPVVWMSETSLRRFSDRLASERFNASGGRGIVGSARELVAATRDPKAVALIDQSTLDSVASLDAASRPARVIVVCDDTLQSSIRWLQHDWVSHVISAATLDHPMADEHLDNVVRTLTSTATPRLLDWLEPSVSGRRIRLTHASKRVARLDKMTEFFEAKNVGSRTLQQLRDAAEELLTNAFYDAPVTAGALKKPISRTQDIALPDDAACDIAYGSRDDLAIVRVRDPFGSLSRRRLVEVLSRCARTDMKVEVDETMGGAGLGLWRIFSAASFVAVSVVKNRHTEFLIGIAKRVTSGPRPFAYHLFFRDSGKRSFWQLADDDTSKPSVNKSVMLIAGDKAK